MRKNFGVQAFAYPLPVYIIGSYDKDGKADAMNAAWGGISGDNQMSFCLSPSHKTVKNVLERGYFTVSIGDAAHAMECDYVGIESGNDVPNKMEKAGFHTTKAQFVDAPLIEELPMAIECKLVSYDQGSGRMVGEIVNVNADSSILDESGNIDPAKFVPIVYDPVNHTYLMVSGVVGNAFEDGLKLK